MKREEKLKLLLDTGEYDFIKYIPKENMWKLIFALAYIEDTIPMSDIDGIKAEINTEISDYEGCADFNEGIRFGLRTALEIIDKYIAKKEGFKMTLDEAIKIFLNRGWITLEGGTYFDGDKWREAIMVISDYFQNEYKALEQEPKDEYIKVPKKALKYRTTGMVAYNVEWLKNHFDIERAVICGAQQPCEDTISRQAAIDALQGRK